jgi:hypothetical protein
MPSTPSFIPGLEMGRLFYQNIIEPAVRREFPQLKYAAALIGPGSEVLGFDTAISTDHDWRPRVFLFIENGAFEELFPRLSKLISDVVPERFMGFPARAPAPNADLRSRTVHSVDRFWREYVGFSSDEVPSPEDWLTFPEHRLLGLTSGAVYFDETGELARARERFRYYPDDIRLYMAAAEWRHIAQEEAFLGRTGDVGDEIGSQIIASRLVRHIMRLCFIVERKYYPYTKWFGTAYSKLNCASIFLPLIGDVLGHKHWKRRETAMSALYSATVELFESHNMINIKFETKISSYYTRPYQVLNADRFANALRDRITSESVKRLPSQLGSVEQFVDSTDIVTNVEMCKKLKSIYN